MAKIRLTKGELKHQRDSLKQFQHYLPTLQLKKQQLQIKISEARALLEEKERSSREKSSSIMRWAGLLADPYGQIKEFLIPKDVVLDEVNIAGAVVPVLQKISFKEQDYDLYAAPLWIDRGIAQIQAFLKELIGMRVVQKQIEILQKELRVTTQRVNLFEKVKIPECLENIRKIRIYLGDQQANAVGISKVAKRKIEINMMQMASA